MSGEAARVETVDVPADRSDTTPFAEWIIIAIASALLVMGVMSRSFVQSSNDASRWNTVWNLAHRGTYRVDGGPWGDLPMLQSRVELHVEGPFFSMDTIRRGVPRSDGSIDYGFYSSKPPLFPTILAAAYVAAWRVTDVFDGSGPGLCLAAFAEDATGDPYRRVEPTRGEAMGRALVLLVVALPFVGWLALYRRFLRGLGTSAPVRLFCLATAALATHMLMYSQSLNNHTLAGIAAFVAAVAAWRVGTRTAGDLRLAAVSGLAVGIAATLELPALALVAALFVHLLAAARGRDLAAYCVAAAIPLVALVATNYLALDTLVPAQAEVGERLHELYRFPGAAWDEQRLEELREPRATYLLGFLVGHRGILSHTPVLLVALLGATRSLRGGTDPWRGLVGTIVGVTIVVMMALLVRTIDYGGLAQGFRWTLWLVPLWLLSLPSGAAWFFERRSRRLVALVLLVLSMLSAFDGIVAPAGPWSHSWLERLIAG